MTFNSLLFVAILPLVLVGHAALSGRALRWWLVVASYVIYGWGHPWYCLLLFASTLLDYGVALRIHASTDPGRRKAWLWASMVGNLGLLFVFKYIGLFDRLVGFVWGLSTGAPAPFSFPELPLPVGISFYTFQTLSYTIDVYRGRLTPTRDFDTMALYVAFFPQLVAGPIERAGNLLPQLAEKQPRTGDDVIIGVTRILWGLVKKVVFADALGAWVATCWSSPETATPWELFLALHAFSFEVYLDFSGYSDIAVGLARTMGIRLQENFRWPFLARNPVEFWTRWHISLTTWVRDYLYVSMGGNKLGSLRTQVNGLVCMLAIGLWHGADEKFLVWGLFHWIYELFYRWKVRLFGSDWSRDKPYTWSDAPAVLLTYFLVIPQVFFGAPTLEAALTILSRMGGIFTDFSFRQPPEEVARTALLVGIAMAAHVMRGLGLDRPLHGVRDPWRVGALWAGLILLLILFHAPSTVQFYYFQF